MNWLEKTKDSRVQWIGDIPEHWEVRRLKFNGTKIVVGQSPSSNSYSETNGIPFIQGSEEFNEINPIPKIRTLEPTKIAKKGTILISIRAPVGELNIADSEVCIGRGIAGIECEIDKMDYKYLYYFLRGTISQLQSSSRGTTYDSIRTEDLQNIRSIKLSIKEQRKIREFLDHETTKIISQLRSNQKLIELLKEKRQAVIDQMILGSAKPSTKGARIPWFENTPEEWKTAKLKYHVEKIGSGITPRGGSEIYVDAGIPFIREQNVHFDGLHLEDVVYITQEIHDEMNGTKVRKSDVLLNITGASLGRCTTVPKNIDEANVSQHVCIIRPKASLEHKFLCFYLASSIVQSLFNAIQVGASRQGLTFEDIGSLNILMPTIEQQIAISSYLHMVTTEITEIIKKTMIQNDLLEEYHEVLMTNSVTGKINLN